MSSTKTKTLKQIKAIPIDQIRFLNPRVRNRRNFQEIVQSIAKVGLKRPITVSPRKTDTDSASYDLVCGQGRIHEGVTKQGNASWQHRGFGRWSGR